jgi:hypothetical protein
MTVFKQARHVSLPEPDKSNTRPHNLFLQRQYHPHISTPRSPYDLVPSAFPNKTASLCSPPKHNTCPVYLILCNVINSIRWSAIMKHRIMQFSISRLSPSPLLWPRYFSHDPVLEHPLPLMWQTKFHTNKNQEAKLQLRILNITFFVKCVSDVKHVSNRLRTLNDIRTTR